MNSDARKKSLGRPRNAASHQAILQATLELLAEVGFEAMSMEVTSTLAGVDKTTIYRRYSSKDELVAGANESMRESMQEEVLIPDTGNLLSDMDTLIENAAQITFAPLGRQTVAMIISSALSNPGFAQVYWEKYLQPQRQAFTIAIERAKARNEVQADLDSDLVFGMMTGIMLYALIFLPTSESWAGACHLFRRKIGSSCRLR